MRGGIRQRCSDEHASGPLALGTMLTAVLSLSGALVFGAADFLGGIAAKRISAVLATAISAATGFVVLLVALPLLGDALGGDATGADVAWGAVSGVVSSIAIGLLYACLAIGPMSILSPLTAVVSAVVPMLWGLVVAGERVGVLGAWALAIALVAVVLVGFVPERGAVRPSLRALAMATGSGVAIGAFFIVIAQTSDASGLVPLVANRGVIAVVMSAAFAVVALAALRRRRADAASAPVSVDRPSTVAGVRIAIACGVVDVVANALLLLGIRAGDLTVAAVLGALYPAGTILLAAIVLRERVAPVQWIGLALALVAAGMLAVA